MSTLSWLISDHLPPCATIMSTVPLGYKSIASTIPCHSGNPSGELLVKKIPQWWSLQSRVTWKNNGPSPELFLSKLYMHISCKQMAGKQLLKPLLSLSCFIPIQPNLKTILGPVWFLLQRQIPNHCVIMNKAKRNGCIFEVSSNDTGKNIPKESCRVCVSWEGLSSMETCHAFVGIWTRCTTWKAWSNSLAVTSQKGRASDHKIWHLNPSAMTLEILFWAEHCLPESFRTAVRRSKLQMQSEYSIEDQWLRPFKNQKLWECHKRWIDNRLIDVIHRYRNKQTPNQTAAEHQNLHLRLVTLRSHRPGRDMLMPPTCQTGSPCTFRQLPTRHIMHLYGGKWQWHHLCLPWCAKNVYPAINASN